MKKIVKICTAIFLTTALILSFSIPVEAKEFDVKICTEFNFDGSNGGQQIPKGSTIHHFKDGTTQVFDTHNSLVLTTNDSQSDIVITPEGPQKANHIIAVPQNAKIVPSNNMTQVFDTNDILILTILNEPLVKNTSAAPKIIDPSQGNGNLVSTTYTTYVTSFTANWNVPTGPPNSDDTCMYWMGISGSPGNLIQPVLQYNNGVSGWSIASWAAVSGNYYHGTFIPVQYNYLIHGSMSSIHGNWTTDTWYNTSHSIMRIGSFGLTPDLVTSLECYKPGGIVGTDNADLPGSMTFHNTQLIYSGVVRNIYWTLHTYYYVPNLSVTWDVSYGNWVSYNTGH